MLSTPIAFRMLRTLPTYWKVKKKNQGTSFFFLDDRKGHPFFSIYYSYPIYFSFLFACFPVSPPLFFFFFFLVPPPILHLSPPIILILMPGTPKRTIGKDWKERKITKKKKKKNTIVKSGAEQRYKIQNIKYWQTWARAHESST